MKSLLISAALAALVVVVVAKNLAHKEQMWKSFLRRHGKKYDKAEMKRRFRIWDTRIDEIENHNEETLAGIHSYFKSDNHLTDWSNDEIDQLNGAILPPLSRKRRQRKFSNFIKRNLSDTVDYRSSPCLSAVKYQGQCGSCWSFSATATVEYQTCLNNGGNPVDLSEQQLVDCTYPSRSGCSGGFYSEAWNYLASAGGQEASSSYAYDSQYGDCTFESELTSTRISTYSWVARNEDAMKRAVAVIGPISSVLFANDNFTQYGSGIFNDPSCPTDKVRVNHAVVIVGYGTTGVTDYWIVRNSWGPTWGEGGYIRVKRGVNMCNIATAPAYPIVSLPSQTAQTLSMNSISILPASVDSNGSISIEAPTHIDNSIEAATSAQVVTDAPDYSKVGESFDFTSTLDPLSADSLMTTDSTDSSMTDITSTLDPLSTDYVDLSDLETTDSTDSSTVDFTSTLDPLSTDSSVTGYEFLSTDSTDASTIDIASSVGPLSTDSSATDRVFPSDSVTTNSIAKSTVLTETSTAITTLATTDGLHSTNSTHEAFNSTTFAGKLITEITTPSLGNTTTIEPNVSSSDLTTKPTESIETTTSSENQGPNVVTTKTIETTTSSEKLVHNATANTTETTTPPKQLVERNSNSSVETTTQPVKVAQSEITQPAKTTTSPRKPIVNVTTQPAKTVAAVKKPVRSQATKPPQNQKTSPKNPVKNDKNKPVQTTTSTKSVATTTKKPIATTTTLATTSSKPTETTTTTVKPFQNETIQSIENTTDSLVLNSTTKSVETSTSTSPVPNETATLSDNLVPNVTAHSAETTSAKSSINDTVKSVETPSLSSTLVPPENSVHNETTEPPKPTTPPNKLDRNVTAQMTISEKSAQNVTSKPSEATTSSDTNVTEKSTYNETTTETTTLSDILVQTVTSKSIETTFTSTKIVKHETVKSDSLAANGTTKTIETSSAKSVQDKTTNESTETTTTPDASVHAVTAKFIETTTQPPDLLKNETIKTVETTTSPVNVATNVTIKPIETPSKSKKNETFSSESHQEKVTQSTETSTPEKLLKNATTKSTDSVTTEPTRTSTQTEETIADAMQHHGNSTSSKKNIRDDSTQYVANEMPAQNDTNIESTVPHSALNATSNATLNMESRGDFDAKLATVIIEAIEGEPEEGFDSLPHEQYVGRLNSIVNKVYRLLGKKTTK